MNKNNFLSLRDVTVFIRKNSVFVILVLIIAVFGLLSDYFFAFNNLLTVTLQTSILALVAIGITFVIITGGIDLSVGSVVALVGALAAGLATRNGLGTYPAILIALLAGVSIGVLNGVLVVYGRLPPFIATLATLAVGRGLTLVYTLGNPISGLSDAFTFWGSRVFGIPVPLIVLILISLLGYVVLNHSVLGLHVFAIGGGEKSAHLASVPVKRVKIIVYMISSFLASIAGIILTARLFSAQPNSGEGLELNVIAAAVLGGTSLAGGIGSISGTLAGAFIIGILSNGLNLLDVPSYVQQVINGLIFFSAVLLDFFIKRRKKTM